MSVSKVEELLKVAGQTLYFELPESVQKQLNLPKYVCSGPIVTQRLTYVAHRIWQVSNGEARYLKNRFAPVQCPPDPAELTAIILSARRIQNTDLYDL